MAASERLYELWLLYYAQKDLGYLQQWLKAFVGTFEKSISLSSLEPRRPEEAGAEVPLLPLEALHVLAKQLDEGDLEQALLLLKLFIVLCRNLENVEAGRGQVLVPRVLALLTWLVAELKGHPPQQEGPGPHLEDVALHALLLCEGLFDPYQTWRRQLGGEPAGCRPLASHTAAASHPPLWCCPCRREGEWADGCECWLRAGLAGCGAGLGPWASSRLPPGAAGARGPGGHSTCPACQPHTPPRSRAPCLA